MTRQYLSSYIQRHSQNKNQQQLPMNYTNQSQNKKITFPEFGVQLQPSASPQNHKPQMFSSPIHIAQFYQQIKPQNTSPDIFIQFSNSFKRIIQNDKEESQGNQEILDIMGNPIGDFDSRMEPQECQQLPEIDQDKQNQTPARYLTTPLKMANKEGRSPLHDITPSMTHRKKKTSSKLTVSEKSRFLTPRTLDKSGLAASGLRRLERF